MEEYFSAIAEIQAQKSDWVYSENWKDSKFKYLLKASGDYFNSHSFQMKHSQFKMKVSERNQKVTISV